VVFGFGFVPASGAQKENPKYSMVLRIYNNPTRHPSIFHSFKKYSSSKANTRRRKQKQNKHFGV
jgi:uncharacterized protein (DUF2249 family)